MIFRFFFLFLKDKKKSYVHQHLLYRFLSGEKRKQTNKQKKISVDKWVVLKQEKKRNISVWTAYIFKHWRRRRVKKTVALALMSDISVTVVLKALWLWQRQLTTSGLTKNHLSTGNSRISEDLRWGVRPAASHLRLTDLNTLPCPRVKSSSRCLTWLWSPTSLCVCMNPVYSCVCGQAMWILAFSVSFSLLACSSREGEWGLLEAAPFNGSVPRLTNVGMELPTGGTACLAATCSTERTGFMLVFFVVHSYHGYRCDYGLLKRCLIMHFNNFTNIFYIFIVLFVYISSCYKGESEIFFFSRTNQ